MNKLYFKTSFVGASLLLMFLLNGCASNQSPLPTPEYVNLERFMGRWYVHGYTPILVDKEAHNAIEHYRLDADEKIQTTYQFRDGGFEGDLKTYTPVGWVYDETTNAEWRMQFLWPFRSDYIILHVDKDYSETIIAHPSRRYAWIMLREPAVSDSAYARLIKKLESAGYNSEIIKKLPHDWSSESERLAALQDEEL